MRPQIVHMGENALLVSYGSRISHALNKQVRSLGQAISDSDLPGIIGIVPAFASVLICFDPLKCPEGELRRALDHSLETELVAEDNPGRAHIIPARYGGSEGPDLEEIAAEHDLAVSEVIRLHTQHPYTVYFLGFLPGFAYMGRVSSKIGSSRLRTPRVRVPAGSVGIAGLQTGIYPCASPGGWRIIGRTSCRVWDASAREPALFAPGDRVRFVESVEAVESSPPNVRRDAAQHPLFEVVSPGALTTIQDVGRPGYAHLGLGQGGVSDRDAAARANALVGNVAGAPVLELTLTGPTLRTIQSTAIALEGADFACYVDNDPVPQGMSWFLRAGATLRFNRKSPRHGGARAFLAVAGGFQALRLLGSSSTCLPAGFGGLDGRALRAGDLLEAAPIQYSPASVSGRYWLGGPATPSTGEHVLRFIPFEGPGKPSRASLRNFVDAVWRVTELSDRMGTRLSSMEGAVMHGRGEMASFPVLRGAIQLPPDGGPLLLGVDHQTTGGYPLLGVVAQADWPVMAQLLPGERVRFVAIGVAEAREAYARSQASLQKGMRLLGGLGWLSGPGGPGR